MQNRFLLLLAVILLIINFSIKSSTKDTTFFDDKNTIRLKDSKTNKISNVDLEDYIVGVVAAEMPASFHEEALKAQAVAARTYAIYKVESSNDNYDLITDVTNQSYITKDEMKSIWKSDYDTYYKKIKNAVDKTKGEIMFYNNEVIEAYYFSMSNGYTEDASLVFSEEKDYLRSTESIHDNTDLKNFLVVKEIFKSDFCSKLDITCGNILITDVLKTNSNRVNYITINDKKFKGTELRKLLDLRSTDFEISVQDDKVFITTKGYGHGVGMSQYGANGMAKNGSSYEEILKYYYKNIEISTL